MAKTSSVQKNKRREALSKLHSGKRRSLKDISRATAPATACGSVAK